MTEEEAKTKWCPMVNQLNHVGQNGGNRVGHDEASMMHALCIASDCMMWVVDLSGQTLRVEVGGRCGLANG